MRFNGHGGQSGEGRGGGAAQCNWICANHNLFALGFPQPISGWRHPLFLLNRRVPSGLPYASVNAHMQRLDVIFLCRFLFEILRYISLLLAMQPPPLSDTAAESTPEPTQGEKQSKGKQVDVLLTPPPPVPEKWLSQFFGTWQHLTF